MELCEPDGEDETVDEHAVETCGGLGTEGVQGWRDVSYGTGEV